MASAFPRGGSLRLAAPEASGAGGAKEDRAPGGLFSTKVAEVARAGAALGRAGGASAGKKRAQPATELERVVQQIVKRKEREARLRHEDDDVAEDASGPARPHTLLLRDLAPGVLTLGVVTRVAPGSATLSLPGGAQGHLALSDLSDEHAGGAEGVERDVGAYLSAGQLVRVCVTALAKKEGDKVGRVEVSAAASRVNRKDAIRALGLRVRAAADAAAAAGAAVGGPDAATDAGVLYGTVKSVEDHGYLVGFGFDQLLGGFLSFGMAGGSVDEPALLVGQSVLCVEEAAASQGGGSKKKHKRGAIAGAGAGAGRAVLRLSNEAAAVAAVAAARSSASMEELAPGMLVPAPRVVRFLEDGVVVRAFELFTATVDALHVADWRTDLPLLAGATPNGRPKGKANTELPDARVLFVDHANKRVALTCLERLVRRGPEHERADRAALAAVVGRQLEGVVRRVDKGRGVLLELEGAAGAAGAAQAATPAGGPAGAEQEKENAAGAPLAPVVMAYARLSRMAKDHAAAAGAAAGAGRKEAAELAASQAWVVELDKKFKVGASAPCRVLSLAAADGVLNVSLNKAVVDASVLAYDELRPAQRVSGRVVRVTENGGLVVSLGGPVRGVVTSMHLADVKVSDPAARFKLGEKLDLRVLEVDATTDPANPKLQLTNKRALVQSDLPALSSAQDLKVGVVAHGVVTGSSEKGVWVTFFGALAGKVDNADLHAMGVTGDPSAVYKVSGRGLAWRGVVWSVRFGLGCWDKSTRGRSAVVLRPVFWQLLHLPRASQDAVRPFLRVAAPVTCVEHRGHRLRLGGPQLPARSELEP
jgi:ribosomal protein S1